jgi:hypothetical protein
MFSYFFMILRVLALRMDRVFMTGQNTACNNVQTLPDSVRHQHRQVREKFGNRNLSAQRRPVAYICLRHIAVRLCSHGFTSVRHA